MPQLSSISLENNQLYGTIPASWGKSGGFLSNLQSLDLSENGCVRQPDATVV